MPRIFQALVVLALLVLSPALAQSSPATLPTQAAMVLPVGVELSDEELAEVEGKIFWFFVTGAIAGAAYETARQAFSFENPDLGKIGTAALIGGAMSAIPAVASYSAATTIVRGASQGLNSIPYSAAGGTIVGTILGATQNPNAKPRR